MLEKRICVVTTTRADYGILHPLIKELEYRADIRLHLAVTGTHLSGEFGYTINEIKLESENSILHKLPILDDRDSPEGISNTVANAITKFADFFAKEPFDLVILLGDRTETLGVAIAAMNERLPIGHIHGGERTEGAVDECVRHAITKMSQLHFPAAEEYRNRIIQMGEKPERVFNVGSLGVENVMHTQLLSKKEIRKRLGFSSEDHYLVITYHPVTLEENTVEENMSSLLRVMKEHKEYRYLITKANSDVGGRRINAIWEKFCRENTESRLVDSLGMVGYLSAVNDCDFVVGNSSSGLIEVPSFGKPTVNIGDRQRGRIMAESVINCEASYPAIEKAMNEAAEAVSEKRFHKGKNPYGDGTASKKIVKVIIETLEQGPIPLKKEFYGGEKCEQ
ncbi:MAG: UDP-N-acetylglucosamine 2-epimerase [Lachnospiraceae bacterium]